MSALGDLQKRIVDRSVSILTLDIETSPNLAYSFPVWDASLHPAQIVDRSRVLMVGAKWYGERTPFLLSEFDLGHEEMVQQSWDIVDRADIIVHYNGIRFDMRHLRREWLEAGLAPPSPFKQIDLMRVVKQHFAYGSNKLGNIGEVLEVGSKIKNEGFSLWRRCLEGDPRAWASMGRYCKGDVRLTERLYDRVRPWITTHPHVSTSDELRCSRCGSGDLKQETSDYRAVLLSYAAYRCSNCGGQVRASYPKRHASTRGIE